MRNFHSANTPIMCFAFPQTDHGKHLIKHAILNPEDIHDETLIDWLDKMSLLVLSIYKGKVPHCSFDENTNFYIDRSHLFHALSGIGTCAIGIFYHKRFFELACILYPEHVRNVDEFGNLPLHIAAGYIPEGGWNVENVEIDNKTKVCNEEHKEDWCYYQEQINFYAWRHKVTCYDKGINSFQLKELYFQHTAINELLKSYPEATQKADSNGRLPLHLCSGNNAADWKSIFNKYPEAIYIHDIYHMYPFMIAAIYNNFSCCYGLLRSGPDVVKMGISKT